MSPTATLAGHGTGSGTSCTATITTGTDAGATAEGATLAAWVATETGAIDGVSDPVNGQWYAKTAAESNGSRSGQWWMIEGAASLPSGTVATAAFASGSSTGNALQIFEVNGAGLLDPAAVSAGNGTSGAPSLASGTPAIAAELVLGGLVSASTGGAVTWTSGTGLSSDHAGTALWASAATLPATGSLVTFTGTLSGSPAWMMSVISFQAGPPGYGLHGAEVVPVGSQTQDQAIQAWGALVGYDVRCCKIYFTQGQFPTTAVSKFQSCLDLRIKGMLCYKPLFPPGSDGTGISFTANHNATACTFTASSGSMADGTPVVLTGSSLPGGFTATTSTAATVYYVVSASGAAFKLAAAIGGTAIGSSSAGSGTVFSPYGGSFFASVTALQSLAAGAGAPVPSVCLWAEVNSGNNLTAAQFIALAAYYAPAAQFLGLSVVYNAESFHYDSVAAYFPGPTPASPAQPLLVNEMAVDYYGPNFENNQVYLDASPDQSQSVMNVADYAGIAFGVWEMGGAGNGQTTTDAVTTAFMGHVTAVMGTRLLQGKANAEICWYQGSGSVSSSPNIINPPDPVTGDPDYRVALLTALWIATSPAAPLPPSGNVTVAGSGSYAVAYSLTAGEPANASLPVAVDNITGDWMIGIVTWRQAGAGAGVTVSLEDDQHNWWEPLGAPAADSNEAGVTRCAVWAAPAALAADWVLAAPTGLVLGLACIVLDVAGMGPWLTVAAIATSYANAATALTVGIGAPGAAALAIAVSGADNITDTITGPGAGWSGLAQVEATNGTDDTDDTVLNAAYQFTTAAATAAWASTGSQDLSAVTVAILVSGVPPTFQQPYWPAVIPEIAPGAGFQTPPSELAWAQLADPVALLDFSHQQGAPYLLGQLQAGQGTMTLDDPDGQLIPPGAGVFAGIDSGTPARLRTAWQGGQWQAQFTGDGTTAAPQMDSGQYIPVTPGQSYGTGAWIACSAPWTAGLTLQISWWNSGGGFISAAVAPQVATGPAPVLAIASGIAPAGAARFSVTLIAAGTPADTIVFSAAAAQPFSQGYLNVPALALWAGSNGAVVTLLGAWAADPRGAPVPCPNAVAWSGYFQQWPPAWDPVLLRGKTTATITDAWGYANKQLQTILRSEIGLDGPAWYWPGTDLAGSQFASDITTAPVPLALTVSKYGSAGAGGTFGQSPSAPLAGDGSSTMFEQTLGGTALADSGYGYCLSAQLPGAPPVHGGITVDCFLQPGFASAPAFSTVIWTLFDGKGPVIQLGLAATTGYLTLTSWSAAGVPSTQTIFSPQAWYNSTAPLYFVVTFGRTGWKAYVTGATGGYATGTFPNEIRSTFNLVNWMGNFCRWATGGQMAGFWGHGAIYPSRLPPSRWAAHQYAGQTALEFAGTAQGPEPVTSRVERLLGIGAMPGRRLIIPETGVDVTYAASASDISGNTTTSTTGTANTSGNTASAALANMAASTVPAVLNITPTGAVMYLAKQYAYNQPVKWVFGTRPDLGELPFTPVIAGGYDPARVVNDIAITQEDTQAVTVPDQDQQPSQDQYGDITYQITGYLAYDATEGYGGLPGLQDLADWIFDTLGRPQMRIPAVSVRADSNPAAWNCWARAAAGDMVTVNWRPPTNPSLVFSMTGRMTQVTKALKFSRDGVEGSLTGAIDYAPEENCLTCDDPVRGQLNGQNVLGW